MQKSKHNVHWNLDKGSKETWSCTEWKMRAKPLAYSTSMEIMSRERFLSLFYFFLHSPFAYASEREQCYPLYVRHCPLNISDTTGYAESHLTVEF